MAARRPTRPRAVTALSMPDVADPATAASLTQVQQAVQKLQAERDRAVVTFDLVVGTNKVRHGLGRPVLGYTITPTFLTIAFGHAINITNPKPQLEVWIDVVGSDQAAARIEVY